MTTTPKGKKIKGYGVFVRAYGGLVAFAIEECDALKIKYWMFSEVSMSRSEDEFKVKPLEITLPPRKPKRKS